MCDVVLVLSIAGGRTESDIIRTLVEELIAHVCPGVCTVPQRSIQDGIIELQGLVPTTDWLGDGIGRVRVGTRNGNLEACAPLAVIGRRSLVQCASPKGTSAAGQPKTLPDSGKSYAYLMTTRGSGFSQPVPGSTEGSRCPG